MKRLLICSVAVMGVLCVLNVAEAQRGPQQGKQPQKGQQGQAQKQPKGGANNMKPVPQSQGGDGGLLLSVGGKGGDGKGPGAKGGKGGDAIALGANGGDAKGAGAKGGKGGAIVAVGGDGGNAKGKNAKGGDGGNVIAIGANGGKATGKGAQGGNGGTVIVGGGNGGNASGDGARGGNGGSVVIIGGNGGNADTGEAPPKKGKGKDKGKDPGKGNGKDDQAAKKGRGGRAAEILGAIFGGLAGMGGQGGCGIAMGGAGGAGDIPGAPGIAIGQDGASGGVVGQDGAPAIAIGQNGADAVQPPAQEEKQPEEAKDVAQTRRFLKVKNDTEKKVRVYVQYRAKTEEGVWVWVPADPEDSQKALTFDVEAGKELVLEVGGKKLAASRVRLWAEAPGRTWDEYKKQDLWLVPEVDDEGEHVYFAPQVGTFTYVFPREEAAKE